MSLIFLRFASAKRKFWKKGGVDSAWLGLFFRVFGIFAVLDHWRVPRALAGPPGVIKIMIHPLSKCDPTKKMGSRHMVRCVNFVVIRSLFPVNLIMLTVVLSPTGLICVLSQSACVIFCSRLAGFYYLFSVCWC